MAQIRDRRSGNRGNPPGSRLPQASPYPTTHNLTVLLDACAGFDDGLRSETVPAVWLTRFAVRFRYPGEPEEPGAEEARSGLDDAK